MHIFSETTNRTNISILSDTPLSIEYGCGAPSIARFSDGNCCALGCIGCVNPLCMYFENTDVECEEVENFPHDQSRTVCPVEALSWDTENDSPRINTDKCISCGICLRRCPIGAIYFDGDIKVNTTISEKQIRGGVDNASIARQNEQIKLIENIEKTGVPIMETDELLDSIYKKLFETQSVFHNLIARNLLISLGCRSSMRRIGDVYTRMDAVYSSANNSFGAVEVEFGRDTLDASRGILDDIAVLHTRYGIEKDNNSPLVVCLQLPNARQGYWQVVKDVKNVENIFISTLTIGAMMILNWNGCLLLPDDVTYYLDYDNMNLRSTISWQIGRAVEISDKFLGILEPKK